MIGLIISGHGKFASGLMSGLELITGQAEKVAVVDFLKEDSTEILFEKLLSAHKALGTEETLILCDLVGGSPFNQSVSLKLQGQGIEVIGGVNLPMVAENIFMRANTSLEQLKNMCLSVGSGGIQAYENIQRVKTVEDGI